MAMYILYKDFLQNRIWLNTRKYPLCGYILGVLTHTTAWDRHWRGDETLNWVLIKVACFHLAWYCDVWSSASSCLMTLGVWGWTRMNIFHSEHMPSNFYYWRFVNLQQELEVYKFDVTWRDVKWRRMDGQMWRLK